MSFDIIFNPFGIIGEARFNIYNYWPIHDCARAPLIVELTSPFHYIYIYIYFFFFRISLYTFYFSWKYPSLKQLFTGWTKLILDYILCNSPFIIVKNWRICQILRASSCILWAVSPLKWLFKNTKSTFESRDLVA